jgi:excisionase family DNA binding protein
MITGGTMIDPGLYAPEEKLTTQQAADGVGMHRRTLVTWIQKGILPATRRPGKRGHYRIKWQDLLNVLDTPAAVKETAL